MSTENATNPTEPAVASLPAFELTAPPSAPKGENITSRTICLALKKGRFGNRRKASVDAVSIKAAEASEAGASDASKDPDKALLGLTKQLLDSPELKAIQKIDTETSAYLKSRCLRSMFKGGIYLLPIALVEEVEAELLGFKARREEAVAAAVEAYPARVKETAKRLGALENARDYPSPERFAACWYLEWQYVTFETPTRLKSINMAIFNAEKEKAAAKLKVAAQECEQAMRASLLDLVEHMVDRLQPGEDGKPKRFTKSLVGNMNEWLRMFELRDVTDDAQLGQIVGRARQVLEGVDAEQLRANDALRDAVAGQFSQLKDAMAGMVTERGSRAISFEDEE